VDEPQSTLDRQAELSHHHVCHHDDDHDDSCSPLTATATELMRWNRHPCSTLSPIWLHIDTRQTAPLARTRLVLISVHPTDFRSSRVFVLNRAWVFNRTWVSLSLACTLVVHCHVLSWSFFYAADALLPPRRLDGSNYLELERLQTQQHSTDYAHPLRTDMVVAKG
jgi:hypothetical protein